MSVPISTPAMTRIIAAIEKSPGIVANDLAKAANIAPKTARAYTRMLEDSGAIHHSRWTPDPKFKDMYRRGFSVGPGTGEAPPLPAGAKNSSQPGRKVRESVPEESSMPEYAAILGALMGKQIPLQERIAV